MSTPLDHLAQFARIDLLRSQRTGMPEIVYAASKTTAQVLAIVAHILTAHPRVLVSRPLAETTQALLDHYGSTAVSRSTADRMLVVGAPPPTLTAHCGVVGIVAAGTSDLPAADEAAVVCAELGCRVERVTDVGVAGIHRLFEPLAVLLRIPVDVIIVAAGMDGALPAVVTGLVDVPVIGLPTAVGYGHGGAGEAALGTMLQSCAPGIAVVNIENGVGAGAMAARIATKVAQARTRGAQ